MVYKLKKIMYDKKSFYYDKFKFKYKEELSWQDRKNHWKNN